MPETRSPTPKCNAVCAGAKFPTQKSLSVTFHSQMTPPPPEPWQSCYQELAPRLLLYARQWTATAADAEDVVQTAFVRFWRREPDAPREHYPLLYAAVRTAALDLGRTNSRRALREDAASSAETSWFDPKLEAAETAEQVERALKLLPAEQREAVVLRIWGELTFQEIADTTGTSINTAAARYRYGLDTLRRTLHPLQHALA